MNFFLKEKQPDLGIHGWACDFTATTSSRLHHLWVPEDSQAKALILECLKLELSPKLPLKKWV